MATKQELIGGLEFLIQESRRVGKSLDEPAWARVKDDDGWKNKEVLAHVAGIGTVMAPWIKSLEKAGAGADGGAGVDIDGLNAGLVAARKDKSVQELVDEVASAYRGVIEFAEKQTDEFWAERRTFDNFRDVPLSELAMRMVVLHGLGHIYSAYAATLGPGHGA